MGAVLAKRKKTHVIGACSVAAFVSELFSEVFVCGGEKEEVLLSEIGSARMSC